MESKLENQT